MPVLLVEPHRAMLATDQRGGRRELRVEAAIASGLSRLAAAPPRAVARGWQAHRGGDVAVLTGPFEEPWARASVADYPPDWLGEAGRLGHVLVVYGPRIGVRTPPESRAYTNADRRRELADATRDGFAAWGLIRWA